MDNYQGSREYFRTGPYGYQRPELPLRPPQDLPNPMSMNQTFAPHDFDALTEQELLDMASSQTFLPTFGAPNTDYGSHPSTGIGMNAGSGPMGSVYGSADAFYNTMSTADNTQGIPYATMNTVDRPLNAPGATINTTVRALNAPYATMSTSDDTFSSPRGTWYQSHRVIVRAPRGTMNTPQSPTYAPYGTLNNPYSILNTPYSILNTPYNTLNNPYSTMSTPQNPAYAPYAQPQYFGEQQRDTAVQLRQGDEDREQLGLNAEPEQEEPKELVATAAPDQQYREYVRCYICRNMIPVGQFHKYRVELHSSTMCFAFRCNVTHFPTIAELQAHMENHMPYDPSRGYQCCCPDTFQHIEEIRQHHPQRNAMSDIHYEGEIYRIAKSDIVKVPILPAKSPKLELDYILNPVDDE
ncbi:hypothetical protein F4810DRAFT_722340 [Camillea tinctor]|nr:hypothetical protein F4810DRAFT_722340 [Camillea tinctor]